MIDVTHFLLTTELYLVKLADPSIFNLTFNLLLHQIHAQAHFCLNMPQHHFAPPALYCWNKLGLTETLQIHFSKGFQAP